MEYKDYKDFKANFRRYRNYIIIFVTSLLLLVLCPFLGESVLGLGFAFPATVAGWVIWVGTKVATAAANLVIFDAFTKQGKQNVKEDPRYIEAQKILALLEGDKDYIPPDPRRAEKGSYLKKSVTLVMTSLASTFVISQAILAFNWVQMISYFVTIVMGIIFGIEQQAYMESLWTEDYLDFAHYREKQELKKKSEEKPNDNL